MPAPALDLLGFWSSVLSSLFLSPDSAGHNVRRHQGQFSGNEGETFAAECLIASYISRSLLGRDDLFNREDRSARNACV